MSNRFEIRHFDCKEDIGQTHTRGADRAAGVREVGYVGMSANEQGNLEVNIGRVEMNRNEQPVTSHEKSRTRK